MRTWVDQRNLLCTDSYLTDKSMGYSAVWDNIALGLGLENNIALGYASFCIVSRPHPSCYIIHTALQPML